MLYNGALRQRCGEVMADKPKNLADDYADISRRLAELEYRKKCHLQSAPKKKPPRCFECSGTGYIRNVTCVYCGGMGYEDEDDE